MKLLYRILICATIVFQSAIVYSQSRTNVIVTAPNPFDVLVPTDYCDVTRKPHIYEGKIIRLRAILNQNWEFAWLDSYDSPACDGMRSVNKCASGSACTELRQRLGRGQKELRTGRAAAVVTGRFFYRKFLTRREVRLGLSRYEFHILKVEEVLDLPKEKGRINN